MKKRIVAVAVLSAMLAGTAYADVNFNGAVGDREFSKDRTLYYMTVSGDEIPQIEIDDFQTIQKAEKPAETNGEVKTENVTVLKDLSTGTEYRFVFRTKETSDLKVSGVKLGETGEMTVSGKVGKNDGLKAVILKPRAKYAEESVKWNELDPAKPEEGVLDILEISGTPADTILSYTFPTGAESGRYTLLITDNSKKVLYENDAVDFVSAADIKQNLEDLSKITKTENNETNQKSAVDFILKNEKGLHVDLTYFKQLSDKEQVAEGIFQAEDFAAVDDLKNKLYPVVLIQWLNEGHGAEKVISDYSKEIVFGLSDKYAALANKGAVDAHLKNITDTADLYQKLNLGTAIASINEAAPESMEKTFGEVWQYLGLGSDVWDKYAQNISECVRALSNKGFTSVSQIKEAIENAAKEETEEVYVPASKKGGSSGGSSGYTAPITVKENEPEAEKIESSTLPFTDLENVGWAYDAIRHMYVNKIILGKSETQFAPKDLVKREEFVKMIVNGFDLELNESAEAHNFADVADGWYKEFIDIAYSNGIVNGISDDMFGVGKYVTREDMAVTIYRAVKKTGKEIDLEEVESFTPDDYDDVSDYAKEAVEYLISKGALKGSENRINPKNNATRAEAAQMIYNIIKIR